MREAPGVHPLTSFEARGRRYYVDADNFPHKALLVGGRRLLQCCWRVLAASDCWWMPAG